MDFTGQNEGSSAGWNEHDRFGLASVSCYRLTMTAADFLI